MCSKCDAEAAAKGAFDQARLERIAASRARRARMFLLAEAEREQELARGVDPDAASRDMALTLMSFEASEMATAAFYGGLTGSPIQLAGAALAIAMTHFRALGYDREMVHVLMDMSWDCLTPVTSCVQCGGLSRSGIGNPEHKPGCIGAAARMDIPES